MALFQEKSEKKSLIITVIFNVVLIFVLFFFGLTYMDPPEEGGIAVNFGTSEVGSGAVQPTTPPKTEPVEETTPKQEESEPESQPEEPEQEEVLTQENEDAPVIADKKEEKDKTEEKEETQETKKEEKKEEKEPEPKPDPKPDQSTSDALKNILSGKKQDGEENQGEGNDNQAGDKGDPSGDPNASSYYGQGKGLDGDGNYRLGGRRALNKQKYTQDCNESGVVVVEIKVNQNGQVVRAKPGVKGTTNTSNCLLEPARQAALDTKFNTDAKAPSTQTGYIIYEFKLSE